MRCGVGRMIALMVDVGPLADAFLRSGMTGGEVAQVLGWKHSNGRWDGTRVKRTLGLVKQQDGKGYVYKNRRMQYDTALRICAALNLDPVDVNL